MASVSTAALFTTVISLVSSALAAPTPQASSSNCPAVSGTGPFQLHTIDRPQGANPDDSELLTLCNGNVRNYTPLNVVEPDGPAMDGTRILVNTTSDASFIPINVVGGYLRFQLPIPRSEPPATANWMSINDNAFAQENAAPVGGRVEFTTTNEGSDGGLQIDPKTGAIYVHDETNNYGAWKLCDQQDPAYLAFDGTATSDCKDVYLLATSL